MVKKERTKNGRPTKKAKLPAKPMIPKARTIANFDTPITELNTRERCELIAELSESILEDPQGAFATIAPQNSNEDMVKENWSVGNQSKMRRLLDLTNPLKNQNDDTTSRLSMLSLLAIFQDILPSYRIRLPTADELSVRVTKETKKIWDYERALLSSYQQYLKLLEYQWDSGNEQKQKGKTQTLGVVCVTSILCFCELLKSASHFNFRSNILSTVVKQMNHRSCDEVSSSCCAAVTHLFETDKQGDVALEAAKLACKMIKDAYAKGSRGSMNVRPAVVKSFLSLPLRVHADEAQAAKLAEQANAKKRKRDQEANDLEQDMREGESAVDKITLARSQADTLHTVVLTYFRILKGIDPPSTTSKEAKTVYNSNLLAPSLEGLGKFGHLINFDTVSDLLVVLKGLLKDVDSLPLGASLNCVLTAFQTLQNAGRELQIDQKEYVAPLFSQLPRIIADESNGANTELAIKCLHAAFMRRKEYSTVRVAAFVKQLCSVAMHAPSYSSGALLAFVRQILHRYPTAAQLLENEQDIVTSGTYTPNAEDPDHTNPFATSAWELATLKFHINPSIKEHASEASMRKMLQLPREDPEKIHKELVRNRNECYVAQRFVKKRHPLDTTKGKKSGRRERKQVRFITPRDTDSYHLKKLVV